jgi:hypothetical protein
VIFHRESWRRVKRFFKIHFKNYGIWNSYDFATISRKTKNVINIYIGSAYSKFISSLFDSATGLFFIFAFLWLSTRSKPISIHREQHPLNITISSKLLNITIHAPVWAVFGPPCVTTSCESLPIRPNLTIVMAYNLIYLYMHYLCVFYLLVTSQPIQVQPRLSTCPHNN